MKYFTFIIATFSFICGMAQPTTSPADPTNNPVDVVSIYGNTFPNIATNYNPNWSQSGFCCTNPNFNTSSGNVVLAYLNFNYQGTELSAQNLSNMEFLHVDVWTSASPSNTILQVTPVNNGTGPTEALVTINHTAGSWYSVDIPKSAFAGMTWDSVFQMKFAANGPGSTTPVDIYLDNVYFWKTPTPVGADASLSDLRVDGVTVPNFAPVTSSYTVDLTVNTVIIPQISVTTSDPAASVTIAQATTLPGTATVSVTSANGSVSQEYTVNFTKNSPDAAPTPSTPNAEVLNIYSDTGNFTNTWIPDYAFGQFASKPDLDPSEAVNEAIRMNFGIAGYGEGTNGVTNITNYNYLHFDYFADANSNEIRVILIGNTGPVVEYVYELTTTGSNGTLVKGAWQSVNVPLSFYQNLGFNKATFFQFKLGTTSDLVSDIVYFDNIYFSVNPGTVLDRNDFSHSNSVAAFPNPTRDFWNISAKETIVSFSIFDITGKQISQSFPNALNVNYDAVDLKSGVYIAKITTEKGTQTIKLLKN
jgi:hypothetical protein